MKPTDTILNDLEAKYIDLRRAKRKLRRLVGRSGPAEMNGETSYLDADAIHGSHQKEAMTQYQMVAACIADIKEIEAEIAHLKKDYDDIKACAEASDKTWKKVYYLRFILGLPLTEVSEELHISYDRCKHIAADLQKRHQKQH